MVPFELTAAERETLERLVRRRKTAQQLALRCRILLRCAEGLANREVAKQLGVHEATVCKWRGRFLKKRLDGLLDEPRPGAPRKISDETVERIVTITLESTPADATHWSTRDLENDIRAFLRHTNDHPTPFIWTKGADQILASIRRFCQYTLDAQGKDWRTSDSPH